ncbi:MAG: hypothetical protein E6L04_00295 [Thaumarchaeota archaeon]|nr:MAG: hypothetical protein E6L04_00295 [Nitrososphaerota archaeon]
MTNCEICGTRFGSRSCVICSKIVCSSCINRQGTRCTKCSSRQVETASFFKRNLPYVALIIALWFFVSGLYPFPYFMAIGIPVDMAIVQPVLIATTLMTIPFIFMLFAWKKRSERMRSE